MVLGQAAQRVPHGAEAAEDVVRGPRAQLWAAEEGEDAWVLRAELMTGGVGGACMYQQTLKGSFSAVSTPTSATKY